MTNNTFDTLTVASTTRVAIGQNLTLLVNGTLNVGTGANIVAAEGAFTAPVLARLAREKGVDMPIVDAVDALIAGRADVDEVLGALLSRPPKPEAV